MPLNRTPPPSSSPNLQHHASEPNISMQKEEAGCSDISQLNITLRNKRKHDTEQDYLKSIKNDLMIMFEKWSSKQDSRLSIILDSIAELRTQNTEIKAAVEFMSEKYDQVLLKLKILEEEKIECKKYVQSLENRIESLERNSRASSIEIKNIPYDTKESKESLCKIVEKTANVLNLNLQRFDIKNIYRINTKKENKPIICEFSTVIVKDKFLNSLKKYNRANNIKLNTQNFNKDSAFKQIFITENLTQTGRRLFFMARESAKKKEYLFCWTSSGKIFLRKKEGSPHIIINNESDLENIK
ncbi:unnamed protein product, partial [Brenthis ino]